MPQNPFLYRSHDWTGTTGAVKLEFTNYEITHKYANAVSITILLANVRRGQILGRWCGWFCFLGEEENLCVGCESEQNLQVRIIGRHTPAVHPDRSPKSGT
jgi:hypothetical protein